MTEKILIDTFGEDPNTSTTFQLPTAARFGLFPTPFGFMKRVVLPVPVSVRAICTQPMVAAVKLAITKWTQASLGKLTFKLVTKYLYPTDYGISFDYRPTGWIGDEHTLATTWFPEGFDTPSLRYTSTTLNGRITKWHRGEPFYVQGPKKADSDLDNTVLHELGHAVGLGHSAIPTSTMYRYIHVGGSVLTPDDVAGIRALYC